MQISTRYADRDDLSSFLKWRFTIEDAVLQNLCVSRFVRFLALGKPRYLRIALKTVATVPFLASLVIFVPSVATVLSLLLCGQVYGLSRERHHRDPGAKWPWIIGITIFIVIPMVAVPIFFSYGWLTYLALVYFIVYLFFALKTNDYENSFEKVPS